MDKEELEKLEKQYIKRFIKLYKSFTFHANNEAYSSRLEVMLIDLLDELGFKDLTKTMKEYPNEV